MAAQDHTGRDGDDISLPHPPHCSTTFRHPLQTKSHSGTLVCLRAESLPAEMKKNGPVTNQKQELIWGRVVGDPEKNSKFGFGDDVE